MEGAGLLKDSGASGIKKGSDSDFRFASQAQLQMPTATPRRGADGVFGG